MNKAFLLLNVFFFVAIFGCKKEENELNQKSDINPARLSEAPHVCTELNSDNSEILKTQGVIYKYNKWENGQIIKIKFLNGTSFQQNQTKLYASEWTKYANLTFEFVSPLDDADIKIAFKWNGDLGSWSYVGSYAKNIAQTSPSMNFGWLDQNTSDAEFKRVVLHEFGHALGLLHEHQSPSASIPWDINAVYNYYMGPPDNWTKARVDSNIFAKYNSTQTNYTAFDPNSIMLYWISNNLTVGNYSTNTNFELSVMDKDFAEQEYPAMPFTGWNSVDHVRKIADVNGDGKEDIVGFGNNDVMVSLFNGNGFNDPQIWYNGFTVGWNNNTHVRTLADVNGDGKEDIVGFGNNHVFVALSNGISFNNSTVWHNGFVGWSNSTTVRRVADVNGDGRADIVGFGNNDVFVALSNGSSFGTPVKWNSGFTNGWNTNTHQRLVADVNGDGKADIVGFGNNDVLVALSNGTGFGTSSVWYNGFTSGWNNSDHLRTLSDVNGDGRVDIVGFGNDHVFVALSNGTSFGSSSVWYDGYTNGWNNYNHHRSVNDIDGDGKGDIVGIGNDDVLVALSSGNNFNFPFLGF